MHSILPSKCGLLWWIVLHHSHDLGCTLEETNPKSSPRIKKIFWVLTIYLGWPINHCCQVYWGWRLDLFYYEWLKPFFQWFITSFSFVTRKDLFTFIDFLNELRSLWDIFKPTTLCCYRCRNHFTCCPKMRPLSLSKLLWTQTSLSYEVLLLSS